MPIQMLDEITYPFPNFNVCTLAVELARGINEIRL